jgi:hypothetical protein
MKKLYAILFLLSIVLFSCTKTRNIAWMYYDETQCADKWAFTNNNEMLKDNVMNYLKSQKVKAYEMEIFNNTAPESCTACTCKTGRRYKIKIRHSDIDEAKRLGLFE